jgi:hypothetical protein
MSKNIRPSKYIWLETDFETMGWHDNPLYGIQFYDDVRFDIDYIFQWLLKKKENYYEFSIAPATLQFLNCRNLEINIELDFINGLEISDLQKKVLSDKEQEYRIEFQEGYISLIASGLKQYIRKDPIIKSNQFLTEKERGGYSFELVTP